MTKDFDAKLAELEKTGRDRPAPPMQIWVTGWWWSKEFTDPEEARQYYEAIGRRMKISIFVALLCGVLAAALLSGIGKP